VTSVRKLLFIFDSLIKNLISTTSINENSTFALALHGCSHRKRKMSTTFSWHCVMTSNYFSWLFLSLFIYIWC